MAKLKSDSIQQSDLKEYLDSSSDFGFELSVLKLLRGKEFECEHGGLYEDPVTGKSRQFDIRAIKTILGYRVRLAVECKNIRENFPILISCIPRHEDESYHQIALPSRPNSYDPFGNLPVFESRFKTVSIRGKYSIYKPEDFVGKSIVQVGRDKDGNISTNDSELYDKWSQCLSSSNDLVESTYGDEVDEEETSFLAMVIPVVVVPNGRLWSVKYDNDGNRVSEPSQTDRCSCFIDKDYEMGNNIAGTTMLISHFEIMTIDGLNSFVDSHLKTEEGISKLFSIKGISEAYA